MPVPIALFTYKRLDTLKQTIIHLRQNKMASESDLYIFCDGAKNPIDEPHVKKVHRYIESVDGFKKVYIVKSKKNRGCANSIIKGVSDVLAEHESVIVVEDDLFTTPNFLCFMNKALEVYQHNERVLSISGYSLDLDSKERRPNDTYFLPRGWPWGWATWKTRWENVDWEVKDYEEHRRSSKKRKEFSRGGSDLNRMLRKQMEGELDAWDIRWFYHQYKTDTLTLYPTHSKVINVGFDAMATHSKTSNKRFFPVLDESSSCDFKFNDEVEIDKETHRLFLTKMGLRARILAKVGYYLDKTVK
ncbi:sugar transferase [Aggregatimonas sangjinii]|uniref:Sugar transferase n=1 Tax=Aggregatimonas sangjinii TaxID=2583587 RepID=A0A5B7SL65_9FLAO|nr:sugar transferase [Aggregatimonas sangjinii]QCW98801.1 sugar transferase [Aggregatimonas sangjinii]